jgi:antitoxin component YwqK of YwqJK toxin-antitoxin module
MTKELKVGVHYYDDNTSVMFEYQHIHGVDNGYWKGWYRDGRKSYDIYCVDGLTEGEGILYDDKDLCYMSQSANR